MELEKPTAQHKCDICGAAFRDADALAKHEKVHTSDRGEMEQGTVPPMYGAELPTGGPSL